MSWDESTSMEAVSAMWTEFDERMVFVDVESGGLFDVVAGEVNVSRPVIQIAAIAVDGNYRERETFEVKIQFDEAEADPQALAMNHYNREVWTREALPADAAAARFAAFLRWHATVDQMSKIVAHNAERFDGPLIHAWFNMLDCFCPAAYRVFCTKQRAYWLFQECKNLTPPANFKLTTLCEYFGIRLKEDQAHDALNDVRATVLLYQAILKAQQEWSTGTSQVAPAVSSAAC
jgi:DNA polymerase III epsilon subunit-like protein